MADINLDLDNSSPTELLGQGIRAYMMRDYNSAVAALSRASEIGVKEYNNDKHESLAEIYLFYGKALLELSREEAEPLGDAIPHGAEDEDDEEIEQEENETKTEDEAMEVSTNDDNKTEEKSDTTQKTDDVQSSSSKVESSSKNKESDDNKQKAEPSSPKKENSEDNVSSTNEEEKPEEAEVAKVDSIEKFDKEVAPSKDENKESLTKKEDCPASSVKEKISGEEPVTNGQANDEDKEEITENGVDKEKETVQTNGVDPGPGTGTENGEKEEEVEEEPTDLQVAWEVLELAKIIYENKGESSKKDLAETLITLGEISMESENFDSAIIDIKQGLEIQKTILEGDSRKLAETYYKLGMALSTNNQIEEAVENFNHSLKILNKKIEKLKENSNASEVQVEIEEIQSLIPEIEEKIADMKSFKEEAIKKLSASLEKKTEEKSESNGSDVKANDISHLVKRKRKIEEITEELEAAPAKKKTPDEKKTPEKVETPEEATKTAEEVKTSE